MSPVLSQYPHLPSWVFPAFELFSSVLVALAVSGWSSITGLVALGAFLAYNIATYQVPLPSQTYTLSSLMAFKLFGLAAYILITDMKTEIREIRIEKDEKGQEIERIGKPPSSLPLLRKLYWSLIYVVWNPRGLGHTTQVKGITPLPRELSTRWKFVLSRLKLVLWNYFLVDVAQVWMMDINPGPFRSLGEHHISVIGASQSQFQRWMNVGSYSLLLGAGMGMFTYLLAAIIVGVGLGEPQEYPDLLGDFKECYTMRKFWG
ncbi:hypothetical protein FRC03_008018 [Tulasnella sp. 419]|nr:hypothetical protein FRC03_008018 [Tulasnella sp. 419]